MAQKPSQSPWKKLMSSAISNTSIPVANVLMFGDESSGKRSLLNALLASQNQRNEINLKYETAQTSERKKKYEHLYIFDYRYLRVNRFIEDDSSEIGKINFYSLNKKFTVA
jgi:predicted GTPase